MSNRLTIFERQRARSFRRFKTALPIIFVRVRSFAALRSAARKSALRRLRFKLFQNSGKTFAGSKSATRSSAESERRQVPSAFLCSLNRASASQIAILLGCGIGAVVIRSRVVMVVLILFGCGWLGVVYFLVIVTASKTAGITKKQKISRAVWSVERS